jgi:hypothetical protein
MHTDVFRLPKGTAVPHREYQKLMKLLQRTDIREALEKGDRQRKQRTIYLDVFCGKNDKAARDIKPVLEKHQKLFNETLKRRVNEENIVESKKAYEKAGEL